MISASSGNRSALAGEVSRQLNAGGAAKGGPARLSFRPTARDRPVWVAVSMGRRNTCLKSYCLVFRPESFPGASDELAQQPLPIVERKAQKSRFTRETPVCTGDEAVSWTSLPVFPSISAWAPFESLDIALIQIHFRYVMTSEKSVASTG
jgi:hypothetical protein